MNRYKMAAINIKEEKPDLLDLDDEIKTSSPIGAGGGGGVGLMRGGRETRATAEREKKQATLRAISSDVKHKMSYRLKAPPSPWLTPQSTMSSSSSTNVATKRLRNGILKRMEDTQQRLRLPTEAPNNNNSRCGEIFVTNNAKRWTFVCTFCQKSTRDIGEFVCHIKFKHMGTHYDEDEDDEEEDNDDNEDGTQENSSDLKDQHTTIDESYNQGHDVSYYIQKIYEKLLIINHFPILYILVTIFKI